MSAHIEEWAARYIERFNFALTPLHGKVPFREGWNLDQNLIWCPIEARDYFSKHPDHNMGACLGPSKLVSVDQDFPEGARQILQAEGIDLDALIQTDPTILGRAPRSEYQAPAGIELSKKAVVWPPRRPGEKPVTVLEFRAGRVQDVLPPSIHPDTKQPYRWLTPPRNGFPPLPERILSLWLDFDAFKHRARNLCPWAEPELAPERIPELGIRKPHIGPSVIHSFNATHDVIALLESHGYERAGKRRWKSPHGHGVAGIVLLPNGKVFSHHTSDPLGDERAHDAFDVFTQLQHNGNIRAATRAAAQLLGINNGTRR